MKKEVKIFKTKDEEYDYRAIRIELSITKKLDQSKKPLGIALLEIDDRYRWSKWRCL